MMKIFKGLLMAALLAFAGMAGAQVTNGGFTVLASAAQTAASVTTADQVNRYYKGGHIIINVSAYTSGNYTPKIQGKSPVTGVYYDLLVGTAISATGTTVLKIHPGIAPVANGSASDTLPVVWRVVMTGAAGQSMTFSIEANLN